MTMTLSKKYGYVWLCVALLFSAFLLIEAKTAFGNISSVQPGSAANYGRYVSYNFFATSTNQEVVNGNPYYATTTNATSTNIVVWQDGNGRLDTGALNIAGAKTVTFYFHRGDTTGVGNTGSTAFQVQVSPDGTNWYYWGQWLENASTTSTFTPLTNAKSSFTIPAGTSTLSESMNLTNNAFQSARCIAVKTTDGEASCSATVSY